MKSVPDCWECVYSNDNWDEPADEHCENCDDFSNFVPYSVTKCDTCENFRTRYDIYPCKKCDEHFNNYVQSEEMAMKRNDLKAKNLYTEADMNYNFKSAVLQGIVMCMTALEWHYGWRGKRLTDLYENVKAIAEMPPIFGKHPSAKEQILHLKETYGIDLNEIKVQIEIVDERGKSKGVLKR